MYITQFGGYTLPTEQLDMNESQGMGRRGATLVLGGAGGSYDHFGTGPDPLEEDTISKAFKLQAASASALQTLVDTFLGQMMLSQNEWQQGTRVLVSTLPDGSQRQTFAKCIEARALWEWFNVNEGWVPVQVTWRRSWPVWETFDDIRYLGDHLGTFLEADTANYDFGGDALVEEAISSSPHNFTITNGGNARVMNGVIELDGVIINPTLLNITNGHSLAWAGSLNAGDRLTIYVGSFDVKLNGARGEWANLTLGSSYGQILPMVLEPGANSMRLTSTTPACTLRYYWGKAWM